MNTSTSEKLGLLYITKCLLSLLNNVAGVYLADQEMIKIVLELKNLVLKNNIYTLCFKVLPILINCGVALDRCVNKDHILR